MKKICLHRLAALLMVLLALSACVDEVDQIVYEYEPAKTEFALMVSEDVEKIGRMNYETLHPSASTANMEGICLFPFYLKDKQLKDGMHLQGDNVLTGNNNKVQTFSDGAAWFDNITVPLNTNYFLMYGHQIPTSDRIPDYYDLDGIYANYNAFNYGKTETTLYDEQVASPNPLRSIKFAPSPIFGKDYFNRHSGGSVWNDNHNYVGRSNWALDYMSGLLEVNTGTGPEGVYWCRIEHPAMQRLYRDFVNYPEGRVINASSKTILALVDKLCRDLKDIQSSLKADNPNDVKANALIKKMLDPNSSPIFRYISVSGLHFKIAQNENGLYYSEDPQFPVYLDLPDGALQLRLTPQGNQPATVAFVHEQQQDKIEEIYAYPAQLYYTCKTDIGVSGQRCKDKYTKKISWDDFVKNNFTEDYVFPFARTLVLKSPVRFAMANLSTKVKFSSNPIKDYQGNVIHVPSRPQTDFTSQFMVNKEEKLKVLKENITLTGILVSDQREVGWDFSRETADVDAHSYMVYDKMLNAYDKKMNTNASGYYRSKIYLNREDFPYIIPNYTLLYPSKKLTDNDNDRIFVILEFENGNQEFYGANNRLILPHTRFYITYRMDANALGLKAGERLFAPAELVDLQLTIVGLSGAYDILPDVRMIKTNLGVAAKIKWENGLEFSDIPVHNS